MDDVALLIWGFIFGWALHYYVAKYQRIKYQLNNDIFIYYFTNEESDDLLTALMHTRNKFDKMTKESEDYDDTIDLIDRNSRNSKLFERIYKTINP